MYSSSWEIQTRKSPKLIPPLTPNLLRQFGYSLSLPEEKRQKALKHAVKELGKSEVQKHLVAVRTFNKNMPGENFEKLDEDVKFLQMRNYPQQWEQTQKRLSRTKKSKTKRTKKN